MESPYIDLLDPATFSGCGFVEQFATLRRHAPVHRHPEPDGPGFWVVSTYREAAAVYAQPEVFSSRHGMRLGSSPAAVAGVADRQLGVSDPPQHTRLRRIANQAFTPRRMRPLEADVHAAVDELVGEHVGAGPFDFVGAIARPLPVHVICSMMQLPRADWDQIGRLTTEGLESDDKLARQNANAEIFLYFYDLLEARRDDPGDDLVSVLLTAELAGEEPLTDEEIVVNCNGILVGATETLRYAAGGAMLALAQDRTAWKTVREQAADPALTVEEILRWTAPGVHAMRTIARETELGGEHLRPGERVTVWNCSANRDEDQFPDADTFLPGRTPNHHLTFGWGPHTCIGSRLARIQLTGLLESLRKRVTRIDQAGDPRWSGSHFIHGATSLPLQLA